MFCSNCGKEIMYTSKYCCFCGAKVVPGKKPVSNKSVSNKKSIFNKITDTYSEDDDSAFFDEIYDIYFRIPPGFKTTAREDNTYFEENGITSCMRAYSGSCKLEISVSTIDGFWDLDMVRQFDDVDLTINRHEGLYNPQTKVFKYFHGYGYKLVMIVGANENQLRYLLI